MKKEKDDNKLSKKTRNIIIALIALASVSIIANIWAFAIYLPSKDVSRVAKNDEYLFLDPLRKSVDKKDRIVGFEDLRNELGKYGQDPKNIVSIYFEYIPTGGNISVNKDLAFYPASLVKIPMAMAVMKKVEKGEWKLTNELVLMPQDKNPGYGELYKRSIGTRFTIETLLKELLINSDNTAHLIFLRNIGNEELFKVHEHLGIEDAYNKDGAITVKNFSAFFRSLYTSSYLDAEYSNMIIEILSKSAASEYLASGIPGNIPFAHKIGVDSEKKIYSDSGIVYLPGRTYLLTVAILSKSDNPEGEAKRIMNEISSKVYQYVSTYENKF